MLPVALVIPEATSNRDESTKSTAIGFLATRLPICHESQRRNAASLFVAVNGWLLIRRKVLITPRMGSPAPLRPRP